MSVSILILFVLASVSANNLFEIHKQIVSKYCPFVTLYGLSTECLENNLNQFPMVLGIGYDSITKQVATPFLEMTYNSNKTIQTTNKQIYNIPDQLDLKFINSTSINSTTFTSIDDYLQDSNFGPLGLPSDIVKKLLDQFELGINNIIVTKQYDELYYGFLTEYKIIPDVQSALDYLPESYNEQLYMEFINYWGTDIIISANGGAIVDHSVIVRSCFGGIDLTNQAVIELMKSIYPLQYEHLTIDGNFARFSKSDIINIYGGDPSIVKYDEWNKRELTIENFPIIINPITIPIKKFITNEKKKSNFDQAVLTYTQNYKNVVDKIINNWIALPKKVSGIPIQVGVSGSNWYNNPVTANHIIKFKTLAPNEQFEICESNELCRYLGPAILWTFCIRDRNGSLYAKLNPEDPKIGYYQIANWEGAHVKQGCSTITGTHNANYVNPLQQTAIGMCCTGCIPSIQPPYIVHYRYADFGWDANYPYDGLFSCNCPPF